MYKIAISVFFIIGYSLDVNASAGNGYFAYQWIYLTHWSFILMISSFIYNTILVIIRFALERGWTECKGEAQNMFYQRNHLATKISWALSTTANSVAIAVTIAYWTALYDPDNPPSSPMGKFNNFDVHLLQVGK